MLQFVRCTLQENETFSLSPSITGKWEWRLCSNILLLSGSVFQSPVWGEYKFSPFHCAYLSQVFLKFERMSTREIMFSVLLLLCN